MEYKNPTQAKKLTGISYLGSVNMTHKHEKATAFNELTYALYLSPAKMSGYEVCPMRTKECTALCLNGSGMALPYEKMINDGRIKKTKLFFEHREFFMLWLIDEINSARRKAINKGFKFSVRLNNTSDISPEIFSLNGKNILQIFPAVQFYDYTKVPNRVKLLSKYKNYDLTFSFSGFNIAECDTMLKNKVRVAVVFKNIPKTFMGVKVIDGDLSDLRYRDKKNVIVGLKYKVTKNKFNSKTKFVVQ